MPTLAPPLPSLSRPPRRSRPGDAGPEAACGRQPGERGSKAFQALREARLDAIAEGKSRLWRIHLRVSQVVNSLVFGLALGLVFRLNWTYWAAGAAAIVSVGGSWAFARWMAPRERRLRRHLVCLARHRRCCVHCGYRLRDLESCRCPECGLQFDPNDTRHVLTPESLQTYSSRARSVSAVAGTAVLIWVAMLANGAPWASQVVLALSLLAAFHGLHLYWLAQSRARETRGGPEAAPETGPRSAGGPFCCAVCNGPLVSDSSGRGLCCPTCGRQAKLGEVFVRPAPQRPTDRRLVSIQYRSLLLRWAFLITICGGLTLVVRQIQAIAPVLASLGLGRLGVFGGMTMIVLVWSMGVMGAFAGLARRLQQRLRLLCSAIRPVCPRCAADVSEAAVGGRCPKCSRRIALWMVTGR